MSMKIRARRIVQAVLLLSCVYAAAAGHEPGRAGDEGPAAGSPLDLLHQGDVRQRREVARALADLSRPAPEAVPALLLALHDADAEVRWRAELALGRTGPAAVPGLIRALDDPDPALRRGAAFVLGPLGPRAGAAVPALIRSARDRDARVRCWSVKALGDIGGDSDAIAPALAEALRDPDGDVRRVAVVGLIGLGPAGQAALPALVAALKDADAGIRWRACIALRQMGPEAGAAAPALAAAQQDPDPDVRFRAAQALGRIRPPAQSPDEAATRRPGGAGPDPDASRRAEWYNEAKFGLFIHWGLYSVPARAGPGQLAEWVMHNEAIPPKAYEEFAPGFTASLFDPDAWARLARDTGARYVVLTGKHHDGFCLWDSAVEPYNAVRFAAARRDVLGDLAGACERQGLKFCAYYSLLDWHHPDYEANFPRYVEHMHAQLRELLTRYPTYGLWFDGEWTHSMAEWRGADILAMARALRPLAFVNDRLGRETRSTVAGVDFYTREQEIPRGAPQRGNRPVAWETCQTFGYSWGYTESPDPLKSGERILDQLVEVVSKGGNFLLNIGPRPDGTIPEWF
ncbi:MAG TPA: alpha-L-fucosidase, partial [Isosphaeraceae bacterium]